MKKSVCLVLALALALALALTLAACGSGGADLAPADPAADAPAAAAERAESGSSGNGWSYSGQAREESAVYRDSGAKLIRRAELSIQTEEFDAAVSALNALTVRYDGYFASASVHGGSYRDANARRSGEYVVRVPAEQYGAFLSAAGDLGYVTSVTETSQDVGEQYYDLETRLKTQRTKQARLLELLEKAEDMETILALEDALSDAEYQIEQYSSELKGYDSLIDYATFQIYLNEVSSVTREVGEAASLGQRLAAGAASSGKALVEGAQALLVWCAYHLFAVLFLVLLAAAVVILLVARKRKKRPGRQPDRPQATEKDPGQK